MTKTNFSASNANFWAQLIIFALGLLTTLGIVFPQSPEQITDQIITTVSTSGIYSVIGIMVVSVIMPIYNFIRSKPQISLAEFFGSPNFWVYVVSFALGLLVIIGVEIPTDTADQLVGAIFAKDWASLVGIMGVSILSPLIRWFRDRRVKPTEQVGS